MEARQGHTTMADSTAEHTAILQRSRGGDSMSRDALVELTYSTLRELAAGRLALERPGHTLQPTALVNETYLRLFDQGTAAWSDREHFLAIASMVMRRVLVDHARRRGAAKRGGAAARVPLADSLAIVESDSLDLLALDEALESLRSRDDRKHRVVELRFFGGLTMAETARVLEVSERTVEEDWYVARAWLHRELHERGRA